MGTLRVISRYRSISQGAVLRLTGIAPIWLLSKERANTQKKQQLEEAAKPTIKGEEGTHEALLRQWQNEWDAYPKEKWTYWLIRSVKEWTQRKHGKLYYCVTQALSGHGCFGVYRSKSKKRDSPIFQDCKAKFDDAEHAIFSCPAYTELRDTISQEIGALMLPETLISTMLQDKESWDKIASFLKYVITKREEKENKVRNS